MKDMAESFNGKKGIGMSIGMRLYNDNIFYLNGYVHHYKDHVKYLNILNRLFEEEMVDFVHIKLDGHPIVNKHFELGFHLNNIFELDPYGKIGLLIKVN